MSDPFYILIAGDPTAPVATVTYGGATLAPAPLNPALLNPVRAVWAGAPPGGLDRGTAAAVGRALFMALFPPPAHALYTQAVAALAPGDRLPLLLDIRDPGVAALPWESLLDTERGEFLALDAALALARFLPAADPGLPAPGAGPLRGLLVVPASGPPPANLGALLGAGDSVAGDPQWDALCPPGPAPGPGARREAATLDALSAALGAGYDLLFYAGAATPDGALALDDGPAGPAPVAPGTIAGLLRLPLALTLAGEHSRALAAALGRAGVASVVTFDPVADGARLFLRRLFRELARGATLDGALALARKALYQQSAGSEWSRPTLYLPAAGAPLLRAPAAVAPPAPPPPAGGEPGIEFLGDTSVTGPVVGEVGTLTTGAISSGTGPAPAPPPEAPAPGGDQAAALRPAVRALLATTDDDAAIAAIRDLRAALLAATPAWAAISAARKALEARGAVPAALAAFFADPAVRAIVEPAKERAVDG
jgi:hypothetical protein